MTDPTARVALRHLPGMRAWAAVLGLRLSRRGPEFWQSLESHGRLVPGRRSETEQPTEQEMQILKNGAWEVEFPTRNEP